MGSEEFVELFTWPLFACLNFHGVRTILQENNAYTTVV